MVLQRIRDYEMVLVLSPEVADEEATAVVERSHKFINDNGGEITELDNWGVRRLAYPINHFQEGNYVLTRFTFDPAHVLGLERILNASTEILRHLVTKVHKLAKT